MLNGQASDTLYAKQVRGEIEEAFAAFQSDEDKNKLKVFLNTKLFQVRKKDLPISKSWIYTSLYFFEFMVEEDFQSAFKYLDTLDRLVPILDPCLELSWIILNNQGAAYDKKGDYLRAINTYLEIFNNQSKCNDETFNADVVHNIALAYSNLGDHLSAIEYYQKVIDQDTAASRKQIAEDLYAIGKSYSELFQKNKAIENYEKGLKLLSGTLKEDERRTKIKLFLHLAIDLIVEGNLVLAKQMFDNAKKLNTINFQSFMFLHIEALIKEAEGFKELAAQKQEQAVLNLEKYLAERPNELLLSEFYEKGAELENDPIAKKANYRKALRVISNQAEENYLGTTLNPKSLTNKLQAMTIFYKMIRDTDIELDESVFDGVINVAELAIYEISSSESKAWYKDQINRTFEYILDHYFELYKKTGNIEHAKTALQYSERSKSLLLAQTLYRNNQSGYEMGMDSLVQKKKEKLNYLSQLQLGINKAKSQKDSTMLELLTNDLTNEELQLSYLEQQLANAGKDLENKLSKKSIEQILSSNKDFIEYFYGDSSLYIFQKKDKNYTFNQVAINERLEIQFSQFYKAASGEIKLSPEAFGQLGHSIYLSLVPLKLNSGNSIVIVPDGPLCLIPFDALITENTSNENTFRDLAYLLRTNKIQYQNSLKKFQHSHIPKKEMICFAPKYNDEQRLLNTTKEIEATKKYFESDLFVAEKANKESFLKSTSAYRVIHVAAHALHNLAEPENSKLLFSNRGEELDDLHAFEIQNLNLNSELVVLSACETGKGEIVSGEGAYSLAHNFFIAGSQSVLHSIWNADDQSSLAIMDTFYKNYKKTNQAAKSLQMAKLNYLNQADNYTSHPRFWSGFSYIQHGSFDKSSNFGMYVGITIFIIGLFLWITKSKAT